MRELLTMLIRLGFFAVRCASPFHWKAKKFVEYRKNWHQKLERQLKSDRPKYLLICPSIGEFQECYHFINQWHTAKSDYQFVFAFFSPSGYDQAKLPGNYSIRMMFPKDNKRNAKKLLDTIKPEAVFILNSGIWPNLIIEMQKRNIFHYLVSFYSREKSSFYKPILRKLHKRLFSSFRFIFCYDEKGKYLLEKHFNANNCIVAGNFRFDSVLEKKKLLSIPDGIREFIANRFCMVAGSTEKEENSLLQKAFQWCKNIDIQFIIVPHEIIDTEILKIKNLFGEDACLYTDCIDPNKKILIYNKIGDLFSLYSLANLCLVGRGFDRKEIHNMLEPAVFCKPILIGPKHKKFLEPQLFIDKKLAFVFSNEIELNEIIHQFYDGKIKVKTEDFEQIFEKYSKGTDLAIQSIVEDLKSSQNPHRIID